MTQKKQTRLRKLQMPKQPYIIINGQGIPYSVCQKLLNELNGDWYRVMIVFWLSKKARNPIAYIKRGLMPDADGNKYALQTPAIMDKPGWREVIEKWWREVLVDKPVVKKTQARTIKSDLAAMLRGLADSIE